MTLDALQGRQSKVRTPKSRSRRSSPYPHIAENPEYTGIAHGDRIEYAQDIHSQEYTNPIQLQGCENFDKYAGIYGPQFNMNYISDMIPYQNFQRLQEEKMQYKLSEQNKLHHYGYQNGYHLSINDVNSPRLSHFGDTTNTPSTSPHFDYRNLNPCSRSSSRETNYGAAQGYNCPYSNRSESSVSDVDVVNEETEKRNTTSKFDTLYDSSRVKEENFGSPKKSVDVHARTSPQRETGQQSVIMRRSDYCSESDKTDIRHPSTDTNQNNQEASKCSGTANSCYLSDNSTCNKFAEIRAINDKSLNTQEIYSQCIRAACAYDSYGSSFDQSAPAGSPRQYPMVPQAGYTSVIVDAQQYNLTNGFVH